MEQRNRTEPMQLKVPLSIRHQKAIGAGIVLCILLSAVNFIALLNLGWMFLAYPLAFLILTLMILLLIYTNSRKFANLVAAFGDDLVGVGVEKYNTFRFETLEHGEFKLHYDANLETPNYSLWVITKKYLPEMDDPELDIWQRDTFYKRVENEVGTPIPGYVIPADARRIRSLREIKFERGTKSNRIIARLEHTWMHSEAADIIQTLGLLRRIEERLPPG